MSPAGGKAVRLSGIPVADSEGDNLKRRVFYWNNADFMQQIGLTPMPEAAASRLARMSREGPNLSGPPQVCVQGCPG